MDQNLLAYIYAFSSVLTFSTAAIGFTYFSKKVSALWMNVFKCLVSFMFSVPLMMALGGSLFWSLEQYWPFYLSGVIGLNLADWLMLSAYRVIGPGRSLVLFGFQPFIVGGFSYFVWGEEIFPIQFVAILFFVACLFLFSYERFKKAGSWEVKGLLLAFAAVVFDSIGVILTRYGFDQNPQMSGLDAQYLRTLSALVSFAFMVPFIKINLVQGFRRLTVKERGVAFVASFFGTFLSLVLYMQAIKIGKLATVSSIVLTDPMMSTFFECLWLKVWPSRYLWFALVSFVCAMFCLFYPQWA